MNTTRAKRAKDIKVVAIVLMLIAGMGGLYFIINPQGGALLAELIGRGVIPRLLAWGALIAGTYGMVRRRFSPLVGMLLLGTAFFFAYIGSFIMPSLY